MATIIIPSTTTKAGSTPNKERLRMWVRALRSGAYKQGHGVMRGGSGPELTWCCLGVAQDLAMANGCVAPGVENNWGQSSILLTEVAQWFGLGNNTTVKMSADGLAYPVNAANFNDTKKWTFNQIADLIEREFKLKEN